MSLALALLFEARARSVARACERTDVRACVHRVRLTAREIAQRVREKREENLSLHALLFSLFDQCYPAIGITSYRAREKTRISAEKREYTSFSISIDRSRAAYLIWNYYAPVEL